MLISSKKSSMDGQDRKAAELVKVFDLSVIESLSNPSDVVCNAVWVAVLTCKEVVCVAI